MILVGEDTISDILWESPSFLETSQKNGQSDRSLKKIPFYPTTVLC